MKPEERRALRLFLGKYRPLLKSLPREQRQVLLSLLARGGLI